MNLRVSAYNNHRSWLDPQSVYPLPGTPRNQQPYWLCSFFAMDKAVQGESSRLCILTGALEKKADSQGKYLYPHFLNDWHTAIRVTLRCLTLRKRNQTQNVTHNLITFPWLSEQSKTKRKENFLVVARGSRLAPEGRGKMFRMMEPLSLFIIVVVASLFPLVKTLERVTFTGCKLSYIIKG